jgi:hypothetical protein
MTSRYWRLPELTASIVHQLYLPTSVVFTTGVADAGDHYITAVFIRVERLSQAFARIHA